MKRIALILIMATVYATGCTKTEPTRTDGTDTIDNITYQSSTYYVYGFSFSKAKLVSTLDDPGPDILLYVNQDTQDKRLTLQSNNLTASFYKVGDYADEASATNAFYNLTNIQVSGWLDMADPILPNQVWIYRTGNDHYAKFMIVSTVNETRDGIAYGECTFRWVYQPDGSATFPGK
ncbi:MAG TPA: hypothetical protein VJ963_00690 [Bacteroidales bacterium]|nr:hypothetical protein [Bacteroidales bacterium]